MNPVNRFDGTIASITGAESGSGPANARLDKTRDPQG